MSSLADLPEIVGFFSYSRDDDADSRGALSALRDHIQRELRGRLGRTKATLRLWQDTAAIPHGALWEEEIKSAVAQSVFFIPIVTPTTVKSPHCKREFELFLAREAVLGRRDLIFPLLYIRVPELEDERLWRRDEVLNVIGTRQYIDWQDRRYLDANSTEVAVQIGHFCSNIYDALRRPAFPGEQTSLQHPGEQTADTTSDTAASAVWRREGEEQRDQARRAQVQHGGEARPATTALSKKGSAAGWMLKNGMQIGLLAAVLALAIAVFVLWHQNAPSAPTSGPIASSAPPANAAPGGTGLVIIKSAAFGGSGGDPFDDSADNPDHLPVVGLNIVVNKNPGNTAQVIVGSLQVQWTDRLGPVHGGKGPLPQPSAPVRFGKNERIVKIEINTMFYNFPGLPEQPQWIAGLRILTNVNTYSFGDMSFGPTHQWVLPDGETLLGFHGRAGSYLDQIGCLFGKPK